MGGDEEDSRSKIVFDGRVARQVTGPLPFRWRKRFYRMKWTRDVLKSPVSSDTAKRPWCQWRSTKDSQSG